MVFIDWLLLRCACLSCDERAAIVSMTITRLGVVWLNKLYSVRRFFNFLRHWPAAAVVELNYTNPMQSDFVPPRPSSLLASDWSEIERNKNPSILLVVGCY